MTRMSSCWAAGIDPSGRVCTALFLVLWCGGEVRQNFENSMFVSVYHSVGIPTSLLSKHLTNHPQSGTVV